MYKFKRIILSLDIILWYLKLLYSYTVFQRIGPKIYMITKMVHVNSLNSNNTIKINRCFFFLNSKLYELGYFMVIVLLFMFAFGISTQALMYHNQTLDSSLLQNVFFPAFFIIGGEYFTQELIMFGKYILEKNKFLFLLTYLIIYLLKKKIRPLQYAR